jgi:hypothetical protein
VVSGAGGVAGGSGGWADVVVGGGGSGWCLKSRTLVALVDKSFDLSHDTSSRRGAKMAELQPGIHPRFDISKFEIPNQRVLRKMAEFFHLTRDGELAIGAGDSKYRYVLLKPTGSMKGFLHTDREVVAVFSDYTSFQARSLDAFDHVIESSAEEFRLEKVVRILVSGDPEIAKKLKALFNSKPDAPIVIPFHTSEFGLLATEKNIIARIREFTFSRDLFSVSSPLKSDLYFFGRSNLINEIVAKLSSGENFGLFGLRRSGKTSLIAGVSRALKRRGGIGVTIDCQSPSIHQLKWNALLRHIALQSRQENGLPVDRVSAARYDEVNASESFLKDMLEVKKLLKAEFIAFLFDEVERISFGTASSEHWSKSRDFLLFWQAVRYGFQSQQSPYTFLMVGTNPSAIEKDTVFESDNPLFGNVEKRFIPMFTEVQVAEMVDELGAIMGVTFDNDCKSRLFQDFGGHPFLTRHAASYISKQVAARPLSVDRTVYSIGANAFSVEADTYVESVIGLLKKEYEDEYEMLKFLGQGNVVDFDSLASHDPKLVEHLKGYGLVKEGLSAHYFNIGVVQKFFEKVGKPSGLMTQEDRKAEVSRRRNSLETKLREYVYRVVSIAVSKNDRRSKIIGKLQSTRRDALSEVSLEEMFLSGSSPLYFNELTAIVLGNWEIFQVSLDVHKSDFEYHMNAVNGLRVDAHAKSITDSDFEKARVSLAELEKLIQF